MHTQQQLYELFESYRKENMIDSAPGELYEPINYILELGGKRMRPLLTLIGCDLFDGKVEDALPAAYGIELFHNFTLMHDDIMDHAPLRRGKPTVHEAFDENRAILSGDVMMIYVYEFLKKTPSGKFLPVLEVFNDTAIRVCEGQQYDMNFQQQEDVLVTDYLKMIERKTAVLLACGLKCGAIIAGAEEKDNNGLYEFGRNMGICFQLMDDLLDAFGEMEKFGKKIGGDIEENKKTFLLLKAMELAQGEDKEELEFYLDNNVPHDKKITGIKEVFRNLGIEELTRKEIDKYHRQALDNLQSIDRPEAVKDVLRNYAEKLLERIR